MNDLYYKKNIKISLPEPVGFILKTIRDAGFEAYAVGGCVRDSILGVTPKDWDITTCATPLEIKALFNRTIDTGIQHGTVTVMIKGEGYEVTTYRVDGEYADSRHPREVTFTASLSEDLKRRDFTINAMAYNEEHGVVDCFGGIDDLERGIIRCVGEPKERFTEDALRMLRAVRFSGVLGFNICDGTLNAIKELAESITKISRERIQAELDKLLMSSHPDRVTVLYDTKLINYIFKQELKTPDNYETTDDMEKLSLAGLLSSAPKEHYVRWALFITCVNADNVLCSLKFDNSTIKICNQMLKYKNMTLSNLEPDLRHSIVNVGKDIFGKYYLPYRMTLAADNCGALEELKHVEAAYKTIISRGDCLAVSELAVNGNDIKSLGVSEGKEIGRILNELFELVLTDYTKNDREYLLGCVK